MQELVNHDDLGRGAIPLKRMSELLSAHANEPRPGPCDRQRPRAAALLGAAVIEEPQRSERIGRRFSGCHQPGRKTLAGFVGKVGEEVLADGAGETGGGALDREPNGR